MRIGLMGYNCKKSNADMALHALADALKNCKKSKVWAERWMLMHWTLDAVVVVVPPPRAPRTPNPGLGDQMRRKFKLIYEWYWSRCSCLSFGTHWFLNKKNKQATCFTLQKGKCLWVKCMCMEFSLHAYCSNDCMMSIKWSLFYQKVVLWNPHNDVKGNIFILFSLQFPWSFFNVVKHGFMIQTQTRMYLIFIDICISDPPGQTYRWRARSTSQVTSSDIL